jgi:hypothetical protein
MKFNYKDKTVIVNVSHKVGKSTIINLLGYPLTNYFGSKSQVRKKLNPNDFTTDKCFEDADLKVAIVRDPIERIKSCYNDRIVKKNRDNLRDRIKSFTDFYNNFEDLYKNEYQIKLHSYPQVEELGVNPNYYDLIVNTKDINTKFKPELEKLLNVNIPETIQNRSHSDNIEITNKEIEYFKDFYKEDYKYYGEYFYDSK